MESLENLERIANLIVLEFLKKVQRIDSEGLPEYFNALVDEENIGIYDLAMEYGQNPEENRENVLFLVKGIDIAIKNDRNVYNVFNKTIISGCEKYFESGGLEIGYEQYLEDVSFIGFANYSGCIRYVLLEAENLCDRMTQGGRKIIPFPGGKCNELPKAPKPKT